MNKNESDPMNDEVQKKEFIYEGKAKKLFKTNDDRLLWIEFKDDLTAFNAEKKGSFEGKGELNLKISTFIFMYLESKGISTHLKEALSERDWVVEKTEIVPLEVVVRNKAAGSICKRLGLENGQKFYKPMFEVFYKKDELSDPLLTREHVELLGLCSDDDYETIRSLALEINALLLPLFLDANMDLVDFKMEFGKNIEGKIILADEISPDSCRLWDTETGEIMDKDRFRKDLGQVKENYEEILNRILEVFS